MTFLFIIFSNCFVSNAGEPAPASMPLAAMSMPQAIALGVVEGLTEYLPVSSTGHLFLAQKMMGMNSATETNEIPNAYAICIQAGAILAVLGLYRRRVWEIIQGLRGRNKEGLHLFINLCVAFAPAAAIGFAFESKIKYYLFNLPMITLAWLVGGIAILVISRIWRNRHKGIDLTGISWKQALIIGFAQSLAMWPGVSRSLITIIGGVAIGMSLPAAVEFSFLLGLMTLGAATCYETLNHGGLIIQSYGLIMPIVGLLVAWVSAVVAVKWMVAYLNRHGLEVFGWYRILLAIVVYALLLRSI